MRLRSSSFSPWAKAWRACFKSPLAGGQLTLPTTPLEQVLGGRSALESSPANAGDAASAHAAKMIDTRSICPILTRPRPLAFTPLGPRTFGFTGKSVGEPAVKPETDRRTVRTPDREPLAAYRGSILHQSESTFFASLAQPWRPLRSELFAHSLPNVNIPS